MGAPAGSSSGKPGNSGEVFQRRGACTMSSPKNRTEKTRRRRAVPRRRARHAASACESTRHRPAASSQPRIGNSLRRASMSGRSASVPSGNHFACESMNERGISQGPRCDPATNSRVDARLTGSTGIQKLDVLPALDVVVRLVLVPRRPLARAGLLGEHVIVIEAGGAARISRPAVSARAVSKMKRR